MTVTITTVCQMVKSKELAITSTKIGVEFSLLVEMKNGTVPLINSLIVS